MPRLWAIWKCLHTPEELCPKCADKRWEWAMNTTDDEEWLGDNETPVTDTVFLQAV